VGDYYYGRWSLFISELRKALDTNTPFDEDAFNVKVADYEWNWSRQIKAYPTTPQGDAVKIANELYKKYLPIIGK
jgi:alpha-N-acetylglucosaminidase